MRDLTAEHYLGIYETRLRLIEKGTIQPSPNVVAGVKKLVTALRQLDPKEKVRLESKKVRAIFKRASTGDLLAQIQFE